MFSRRISGGTWSAVFSGAVQRKRAHRVLEALLFSKKATRRLKRCTRKWRLSAAVEKYALHLRLSGCMRTWFDVVRILSWENRKCLFRPFHPCSYLGSFCLTDDFRCRPPARNLSHSPQATFAAVLAFGVGGPGTSQGLEGSSASRTQG